MDYKEKLRQWNSTEKYKKEVQFLGMLLDINDEQNINLILDYGCGLGTTAYKFGADGFDVVNYNSKLRNGYYLNDLPHAIYDHVYFMHSLSHITNPIEVLKDLKQRYNATVTVITPNASWLDVGYNNDPTVIKHYDQRELHDLFTASGYEVTLIGQFGELKNGVNERIFLQAI